MNFSQAFTSPAVRAFSIRIGIMAGLITALFAGWKYGVLVGAIATLAIALILPLLFYLAFLPYQRMKKEIRGEFLFDEPVRYTVKKRTVGGFLVITESAMVFLSGETAAKRLEVSRDQVLRVIAGEQLTVDVYLNEKQYIRVSSEAYEEILDILQKQGWNTVGR